MRKSLAALFAMMVGLMVAGLVAFTAPAAATETGSRAPIGSASCPNLAGWTVNSDENGSDPNQGDRRPEATVAGLKFGPADLIHHATSGTVAALEPGSFAFSLAAGSDEPDQPSFFSVEVNGEGTGKYGTLRWDTDIDEWTMVANGGTLYSDPDPAKVVEEAGKGSSLVSFGVGYTKTPPGSKTVVVKSVTFKGQTYPLTCVPASSSASASASSSASPAASSSSSARPSTTTSSIPAAAGPTLPVTGPSMGWLIGGGVLILGIGGVLLLAARKRKTEFTA